MQTQGTFTRTILKYSKETLSPLHYIWNDVPDTKALQRFKYVHVDTELGDQKAKHLRR
jgi:hypothetical protein